MSGFEISVTFILKINAPVVRHTLTIITEAHLGLAKTNGILARAHAIVLLELGLVDALEDY